MPSPWIAVALATALVADDEPKPLPSVDSALAGTRALSGLLDLRVDDDRGRLLVVLAAAARDDDDPERYLYATGLATGLGSNPVGLDRGRLGDSRIVRLERHGRRLFVVQENWRYRARSARADERRAVEESFAPSVLWSGDVVGADESGRYVADLTGFVVRDADATARALMEADQGEYVLDPAASALRADACLAFPRNVELEAWLTFRAKGKPGPRVAETAATADALTLALHHSLVALPDDGYRPRAAHPAAGYGTIEFLDYAAPLADPLRVRWIRRHRLTKVDPTAARSKVERPIVYHVDRGAPPEIRDALIEGASWWARAFEAAGFVDAFRVEVLPADAHPLDVRYHTIHWVHRSTRGWSYGGGIHDPRTGEIVKGNVRLGSLRVRQDRLLFEGLAGVAKSGSGADDDPVELALARIRQLAAHEVGHTLGLQHNFSASTYGDRASVMDYPAPRVGIRDDGTFDFSDAYGVGVGAWDVWAIRYGYTAFPDGVDERAALRELVAEAARDGLRFHSDSDARDLGSAHPLAHLWDNGSEPVAELAHVLAVRRLALARFGQGNVRPDASAAELREVFVPLYLHHRYQATAAAKVVGGVAYDHAEGAVAAARPVGGDRQRAALRALLGCLEPDALDVPEPALERLVPGPPGAERSREEFRGATGPTFDPLGAATAAADHVLRALLHPARATRLLDQRRRDDRLPGFEEVLDEVTRTVDRPVSEESPRRRALREVVAYLVVDRVLELAASADAPAAVRAAAIGRVNRWSLAGGADPVATYARQQAGAFLRRVPFAETALPVAPEPPPGSPIGAPPLGGCGG